MKIVAPYLRLISPLPVLLMFAMACTLGGEDLNREATAQALSTAIKMTADSGGSSTTLDTAGDLATAQAAGTQQASDAQATRTAVAAANSDSVNATGTAVAPFAALLPRYGVDPSQGHLAWVHPPVTLAIEGFQQYDYANEFFSIAAQDFVLSADITWNTDTGISGCGFVMRSDGNEDALNQYLTVATRGASGHVVFGTMANGELVTGQDIYAYGIDPNFQWENDTTNRLTVVGRGNSFTIYTNDVLLGEVDPTAPPPQPRLPPAPVAPANQQDPEAMANYLLQKAEYDATVALIQANYNARVKAFKESDKVFEKGFLAFVALSESGKTQCQFNNAWLWIIE